MSEVVMKGIKLNADVLWPRLLADRRIVGECWEFCGYLGTRGYGVITHKMKNFRVHRISWALTNGRAPKPGMFVCHTCDNPKCFNPKHLFEGSNQDNARDAAKKGRLHTQNPNHKMRGENHAFAVLTEKDVRQIKFMLEQGYLQKEIAKTFGVTKSVISNIKGKRRWAHVK